jgi:hypothetical protein
MEADDSEVLGQWVRAGERLEEQPRVPARGSREFTVSVRAQGGVGGFGEGPERWSTVDQ